MVLHQQLSPAARRALGEKARRLSIRKNPGRACEKRFKVKMWEKQHEILWSLFNNSKTSVRSCHASGKTYTAGHATLLYLDVQPSRCLTTAPTNNQVEKLLWAEINRAFKTATPAILGRCLNTELKIAPGWDAIGFATDNPLNFQGFHAEHFLVVIDEAANVDRAVFDELKTVQTSVNNKELLIGNPDDPSGPFAESFEKGSGYYNIKIDAFSTPNFIHFGLTFEDFLTGDWIEKSGWNPERHQYAGKLPYPMLLTPDWVAQRLKEWGQASPLFIAKVFAEFPATVEHQLIPADKLDLAVTWEQRERLKADPMHGQFGLDVARYGVDKSVLIYRKGPVADLMWTFNQYDTWELSEAVREVVHRVDGDAPIVVDATGLGAGVADNLKHFGRRIIQYVGNAKASKDEFSNVKAEMYWELMQRFVREEITGAVIDAEMQEELKAQKYKYSGSKVRMWKKDEIKAKLGRSPDKSDALMLAFMPVPVAYKKNIAARRKLQRRLDRIFVNSPIHGNCAQGVR